MLWIIRHAAAVPRVPGRRDAVRPLTPAGRRDFGKCVRGLARLGARFDLVLHSPRLRAVDTADLLTPLVRGRFAVTPRLSRAPTPIVASALLAELTGASVAVVGHEPWLSQVAAQLVTGRPEEAHSFALKKGGVLVLEGAPTPGGMRLAAAYPPRALRRLGS